MAEDLGFDHLYSQHARMETGPVLTRKQVLMGDFAFAGVAVLLAGGLCLLLKLY